MKSKYRLADPVWTMAEEGMNRREVACDGVPHFRSRRDWCDEVIAEQRVGRFVFSGTSLRTEWPRILTRQMERTTDPGIPGVILGQRKNRKDPKLDLTGFGNDLEKLENLATPAISTGLCGSP
ncbi:uncharacterized protein N7459_002842 [Penicillium hispanicum]|uniref:uncharacterized protein n=1 Tax=Penicillium hispanicum TaxID=1080232 RepID=UPI00254113EC|nr:uncharacterized protein N7459_002842 [Penicillium hispanicum]KAJ5587077.1 hypothetical protein N7459_002842 [Penicillium hispanicum]